MVGVSACRPTDRVDAKTVLAAYLDAYEAQDDQGSGRAHFCHASQVRTDEALSLKPLEPAFRQTPEFAVLFLPGEQFLGAALSRILLIEDRFAQEVVPGHAYYVDGAVARGSPTDGGKNSYTGTCRTGGPAGQGSLPSGRHVLTDHLNDIGCCQGKGRGLRSSKAVASLERGCCLPPGKFFIFRISSEKDLRCRGWPLGIEPRTGVPFRPIHWLRRGTDGRQDGAARTWSPLGLHRPVLISQSAESVVDFS